MPQETEQLPDKLAYQHAAAAEAIGVSSRTLARWREDGIVKPVKVRGVLLYTKAELERLLKGESNGDAQQQ